MAIKALPNTQLSVPTGEETDSENRYSIRMKSLDGPIEVSTFSILKIDVKLRGWSAKEEESTVLRTSIFFFSLVK